MVQGFINLENITISQEINTFLIFYKFKLCNNGILKIKFVFFINSEFITLKSRKWFYSYYFRNN